MAIALTPVGAIEPLNSSIQYYSAVARLLKGLVVAGQRVNEGALEAREDQLTS